MIICGGDGFQGNCVSGMSDILYVKVLLLWCVVMCKILHLEMLNSIIQSVAHIVSEFKSS